MDKLETLILEEVKTYVGGLRFWELFSSLRHYDGNEELTEPVVRRILKSMVSDNLLDRQSSGSYVDVNNNRVKSRWE